MKGVLGRQKSKGKDVGYKSCPVVFFYKQGITDLHGLNEAHFSDIFYPKSTPIIMIPF